MNSRCQHLLLALLALAAGASGARQLTQVTACADLSPLLVELPEATNMLSLIMGLGVFKDGVPPNATLFLPSNAAAQALTEDLELPFKLDTLLDALPSLGPELTRRLVSTVLYHVALGAALGPAELASQGDVQTALEGAALLITSEGNRTFPLTITDKAGTQARTLAGPAAAALEACGAAAYVIDKVLLPARELADLPRTSEAKAQAIIKAAGDGGGGWEGEEGEGGERASESWGGGAPAPAPAEA